MPEPPHAAPLLAATCAGELALQRCSACGPVPTFPRIACPRCFGPLEWAPAAGRGRVETFAVVRRPQHERFSQQVPIVLALIELDEGASLIATIVGDDRLGTAVGAEVALAREGRWSTLPQFRLVVSTEEVAHANR